MNFYIIKKASHLKRVIRSIVVIGIDISDTLKQAISRFISRDPGDKEATKILKNDIFKTLLAADIHYEIANNMASKIEERTLHGKLPSRMSRKDAMMAIMYEELAAIMGKESYPLNLQKAGVNTILVLGIQGSGKTTTVGKLAHYLKRKKWDIGIVCTDTWRDGAYEQIKQLCDRIEVDVFGNPDEESAEVLARNGIDHFTAKGKSVIIIDTAGRHKHEGDLIEEMRNLHAICNPQESMLVIDGTIGQDALSQAQAFAQATDIGSIIVSKLDGTARGGGAISAAAITGAPIKFIGSGEEMEALEVYNPQGFASRILDWGDLPTLLERSSEVAADDFDADMEHQLMKGKISYDTMLSMMASMKKMGGLKHLSSLMPGMSSQINNEMINTSKESMKQYKHIIQSMTEKERKDEVRIGRTRGDRLAKGSGTTIDKVRELIKQKKQAEEQIKRMLKGKRRWRRGSSGIPF